jgi:hypothetical protein
VSYVTLLTAQQAWLQTHTALVQAQAARYADTAALFQALGGGWWNRGELADAVDRTGPAAQRYRSHSPNRPRPRTEHLHNSKKAYL